MKKELISKKIDQIRILLDELEQLLKIPFEQFDRDFKSVRAAERNFQLIVDLASDINSQILIEKTGKTPETYRQSFLNLEKIGLISKDAAKKLGQGASLRNILVHEYDFEEDVRQFYDSAKIFLPVYRKYLAAIYNFIKK